MTAENNKELTFYQKLLKVISEVHAPKNKQNVFGNFSYRDAEGILKAAKTPAIEQGLYIKVTKEVVKIDERFYIKATASITDGETIERAVGYAREPESKPKMDESQVTGSASSYAKKYALSDLLMIDDGKDDPDKNNNVAPKNSVSNTKVSGSQLAKLNDVARAIGGVSNLEPSIFTSKIAEMGNVPDISELPEKFYQEALATLTKWKQEYVKKQQNNQSIPWGESE